MSRGTGGQRGQVIPIFALTATLMVGVIALGLDYGVLTNQHRNLQAFVDEAAIAGAYRLPAAPTPTDYANARTEAFIYLRDNLGWNLSPGTGGHPAAKCAGTMMSVSANIDNCVLQSPYDHFTISIDTPAATHASSSPNLNWTVAVKVTDAVTTSFANLLGISTINARAQAVAYKAQSVGGATTSYGGGGGTPGTAASPFNYALYADCVTVGNHLEIVQGGDVYINQCGISTLAGALSLSGLCAEAGGATVPPGGGNILLGTGVPQPVNLSTNQSAATCTAGAAGQVITSGSVVTTDVPPPALPAIPGLAPSACVYSLSCPTAVASSPCTNGSGRSNCYAPGSYATVGVGDAGIQNNLNPGIYYVAGSLTDPCYISTTRSNCVGAVFTGNTVNANYGDVKDACWGAGNNPAAGTWAPGCPDGFAFNPTNISDPQCPAGTTITPPVFTLVPNNADAAGNLDPPPHAGTTYYVRVTAINAAGETTSTEQATVVKGTGAVGIGSITINITNQAGAVGYEVYGPTTTPLGVPAVERQYDASRPTRLNAGGATTSVNVLNPQSAGGAVYPTVDTSACSNGMHNLPTAANQNYGVTFVLFNKASVCLNTTCDATGTQTPTVLLSPYCAAASFVNYACSGSPGDGVYPVYGTSHGFVEATGAGTRLGMTGTVDAPYGTINITGAAQLELMPGQAIVHDFNVQTGNLLNPAIYFLTATQTAAGGGACTGAGCSTHLSSLATLQWVVRLVQ